MEIAIEPRCSRLRWTVSVAHIIRYTNHQEERRIALILHMFTTFKSYL